MFSNVQWSPSTPVTNLMGWLALATTVGAATLNTAAELAANFTTPNPLRDDPITNSTGNTTAIPPTAAPSDSSFDLTKALEIGIPAVAGVALTALLYRYCTKSRNESCCTIKDLFPCLHWCDSASDYEYQPINDDDEEENSSHPCWSA